MRHYEINDRVRRLLQQRLDEVNAAEHMLAVAQEKLAIAVDVAAASVGAPGGSGLRADLVGFDLGPPGQETHQLSTSPSINGGGASAHKS